MPPILRFLILFVGVLFLLLTYTKVHSTRDPSSYFFDEQKAYEPIYSARREQQAFSFVERISMSNWPTSKTHNSLRPTQPSSEQRALCIGMPTMSRQGKQHFPAALGSLLDGLSDEDRKQVYVITFFAALEPEDDMEDKKFWLNRLCDRIVKRDNITDDLRKLVSDGRKEEKSTLDYHKILSECYASGTEYILIAEDDIIAAKSWLPRTLAALDNIKAAKKKDWLYLRLFYSETFLGWNNEEWGTYTFWVVATMVLSLGSLLGLNLFLDRYSPPSRNLKRFKISNFTIVVVMVLCMPLLIAGYFLAGRLTMSPLRTGVVSLNNYGCCSQGLVFERSRVPQILEAMDPEIKHEKNGIVKPLFPDERLERLADKERLQRYAIVPSVFQHVGRQSAYGFNRKTWNFRFETEEWGDHLLLDDQHWAVPKNGSDSAAEKERGRLMLLEST